MIEKAVYSRLSTDPAITSIVSGRVYNGLLEQETTVPAIVFYRINTSRNELPHSGSIGVATALIQITIYSDTVANLRALAEAVRRRLHGYKGTAGTVAVLFSQCMQERDGYAHHQELFSTIMEFRIKYRETI